MLLTAGWPLNWCFFGIVDNKGKIHKRTPDFNLNQFFSGVIIVSIEEYPAKISFSMELPEVELSFCCCFFEIHETPKKPTRWDPGSCHPLTDCQGAISPPGCRKWPLELWNGPGGATGKVSSPTFIGTSWQSLASNGSEFMKYSKVRKKHGIPKTWNLVVHFPLLFWVIFQFSCCLI